MVVGQILASTLNVQSGVLFVVVLLLTVAWVRRRRPRNLPPGPRPWPILGNIRELQSGQLCFVLADWAKKYGSVFSVWMGPRLAIILNDIDIVKEALVTQADCFSSRPGRFGGAGGSIVMANGHVWKERRRFGLTAMRNLGMGKRSVEYKINEEARHLLKSFEGEGEKPFDPSQIAMKAVANIISAISFGSRFEYSDPEFARLLTNIRECFMSASFSGGSILRTLMASFLGRKDELKEARIRDVQHFIEQALQEHRETFDPNDMRDIMDMYISEIKQQGRAADTEGDDVAFSEKTVWRGIADLFIAGTDTTTNTLRWLFLFMASYPDVQKKVQKEIDDVVGGDRQPTSGDRNNMPYTNAIIMEVQRMRPVAPTAVPHMTSSQTELHGYTIPAKTMVFVNILSVQHDPKYWKDPEKFDPTRFLSKDGKTVGRLEALIPFSLGRRICLGETLAKMELFLFFTNLLQRFTLCLPAGQPRPPLEGTGTIDLAPHPYKIVAKNR